MHSTYMCMLIIVINKQRSDKQLCMGEVWLRVIFDSCALLLVLKQDIGVAEGITTLTNKEVSLHCQSLFYANTCICAKHLRTCRSHQNITSRSTARASAFADKCSVEVFVTQSCILSSYCICMPILLACRVAYFMRLSFL